MIFAYFRTIFYIISKKFKSSKLIEVLKDNILFLFSFLLTIDSLFSTYSLKKSHLTINFISFLILKKYVEKFKQKVYNKKIEHSSNNFNSI